MSENMDEKEELNYDELIPTLPRDKDGFVLGFDIYTGDDETKQQENKKEILEFFERYGMVVITNLLTDEELIKSQVEVYDFVEDNYERFKRDDTSTWEHIYGLSAKLGMITDWPCMKLQYCKNRCNPNIYRAFSYVLDNNDIYCNIGRVGYFRPTKNIPFVVAKKKEKKKEDSETQEQEMAKEDDQIKDEDKAKKKEDEETKVEVKEADSDEMVTVYEDRPEWKTADGLEWLHIDYNPALNHSTTYAFMPTKYTEAHKDKYDPYQKARVQGILALADCDDSTGSFQCVPGFHRILDRWFRRFKASIEPRILMERYQFKNNDPILKYVQHIQLRKGSLVVWNSKLPHCSYPNNGEKPRMVQYIQFARRDDPAVRPVRLGVLQRGPWGPWELNINVPSDFEWTPLAKQIYSIDIPHPDELDERSTNDTTNRRVTSKNCHIL